MSEYIRDRTFLTTPGGRTVVPGTFPRWAIHGLGAAPADNPAIYSQQSSRCANQAGVCMDINNPAHAQFGATRTILRGLCPGGSNIRCVVPWTMTAAQIAAAQGTSTTTSRPTTTTRPAPTTSTAPSPPISSAGLLSGLGSTEKWALAFGAVALLTGLGALYVRHRKRAKQPKANRRRGRRRRRNPVGSYEVYARPEGRITMMKDHDRALALARRISRADRSDVRVIEHGPWWNQRLVAQFVKGQRTHNPPSPDQYDVSFREALAGGAPAAERLLYWLWFYGPQIIHRDMRPAARELSRRGLIRMKGRTAHLTQDGRRVMAGELPASARAYRPIASNRARNRRRRRRHR